MARGRRNRKNNPTNERQPVGWTLADTAIALCFFLSGAAALTLEITWVRKASLAFGSTSLALSTVLAAFFTGLAIGSYAVGRVSTIVAKPLRLYGWIETGVGLLAALSPAAFGLADRFYHSIYPFAAQHQTAVAWARFLLIFVLILPPTLLMGASLPLLCRHYIRSSRRMGFTVSLLYGLNTIGAACGAGFCGFIAIPTIGVNATITVAAGVCVAIGLVAVRIGTSDATEKHADAEDATDASHTETHPDREISATAGPSVAAVMHALFFLVGFVALANEVLWTRFLSLMIHNTVHTYTLTLMLVLVGIALGSLSAGWVCDRTKRRVFIFGLVQVAGSLLTLLVVMAPAEWWTERFDLTRGSSRLWVMATVLLVPAWLSGISFPLAVRVVLSFPKLAGRAVGGMTAANTIGGVVGALTAGFLALPGLGLHVSLLSTTAIGLLIGGVAWFVLDRATSRWVKSALALVSVTLWFGIPRATKTQLPADLLAHGGALVDFREGRAAHLAVIRRDGRLRLEIDKLWQGEDRKTHQIMAAHIPALLHPAPKDVLAIGMGTGQTFSRFLMYDIDRLDCVEIERELIDIVRDHYDSAWMDDPRAHIVIEDGRNYVHHSDRQYDIVSLAVGQTFRSGVAAFYTTDFYRATKGRMKPEGLISQFVPLPLFTVDEFRRIVQSFLEVFPESALWYNNAEMLLIGANGKAAAFRTERLAELVSNAAVRSDLEFSHWGGPREWLRHSDSLLACYLVDGVGLSRLAQGTAAFTDDLPRLEYSTAAVEGRDAWNLEALDEIRAYLAPVARACAFKLDDAKQTAAGRLRDINLNDIHATRLFQAAKRAFSRSDPKKAERLLEEATRANPRNFAVRSRLANVLMGSGRLNRAASEFAEALRINPDSAKVHLSLGLLLERIGRPDEAVAHFRGALTLDPDYAEAHTNLGSALLGRGQVDAAIAHYHAALRVMPEAEEVHANLGVALASKGDLQGATARLRRALEINPKFAEAHLNLGRILLRLEQPDAAVHHLERALAEATTATGSSSARGAVSARNSLADALIAASRSGDAVMQLRESLRDRPNHVGTMVKLSELLATCKVDDVRDGAEAVLLAEEARGRDGDASPIVLGALAAAFAEVGRFEDAQRVGRRAVALATNAGDLKTAAALGERLVYYDRREAFRR